MICFCIICVSFLKVNKLFCKKRTKRLKKVGGTKMFYNTGPWQCSVGLLIEACWIKKLSGFIHLLIFRRRFPADLLEIWMLVLVIDVPEEKCLVEFLKV